jgi:hypothetical protein
LVVFGIETPLLRLGACRVVDDHAFPLKQPSVQLWLQATAVTIESDDRKVWLGGRQLDFCKCHSENVKYKKKRLPPS